MKIVKPLKDSSVLIKVTFKQLKLKQKNRSVDFLVCCSLGANLIGNLLSAEGDFEAGDEVIRASDGMKKRKEF